MWSKNKPSMTAAERQHVDRIKEMSCITDCGAPAPSEAHEIEQGQWFTSIPVCPDCHRGSINGLHGQQRIWKVKKLTELDALNETLRRIFA